MPLSELEQRIAGSAVFRDLYPKGSHDAADRVEVLDELGIDVQLINPTVAIGDILLARTQPPDLERAVIETYNTWATDTCAGYTDRVVPIVYVDVKD